MEHLGQMEEDLEVRSQRQGEVPGFGAKTKMLVQAGELDRQKSLML